MRVRAAQGRVSYYDKQTEDVGTEDASTAIRREERIVDVILYLVLYQFACSTFNRYQLQIQSKHFVQIEPKMYI